ncbi:MAG: TonB-dependent receptor [Crocinitomicaceae bacterium]
MRSFLFIIAILSLGFVNAQTYKGVVQEVDNPKNKIPFAKIYLVDLETTILADSAGYWQVDEVPKGVNHLIVSASGYKTAHLDLDFIPNVLLEVELPVAHHHLDKVIISNNGLLHRESITNVESHQLSELNKIPAPTLGDALVNIPGVYQTGIGVGVSKPLIRGLSGSRVVTYLNTLRIQNQQWGSDHGMSMTSLGIGSVEVIKGPASLLYGADALGGVLYFVDEPYAEQNSISGFVQSNFHHNSLGTANQAGIRYSKNSFRINVYGGYENFADYETPNGKQVLNSRFKQSSAKLALGFTKKKWVFNLRYNFYDGRIGLPGHTHDSVPDVTSFLTDNQSRKNNVPAMKIQNHFTSVENKFFLGKHEIYLTLGNTNNLLKEFEEKFTIPEFVVNLNNTLYNAKWRVKLTDHIDVITGSQGMLQINKNGEKANEILIPDAEVLDVGGYALVLGEFDKWRVQFGGRYDNRSVKTMVSGFNESYQGVNYAAGFARIGKKSTVRFNLSSGFRAPTSSELLSDGVHHGSFRYEIGQPGLTTEKAIQIDASYGIHLEDLEIIINPFYNRMTDYIYIQQKDSMINQFQVFEYTQADFAQLYGADMGFHYHPHRAHWLHIESSFSLLFAEDQTKAPIPLTPPARINSQLSFEIHMHRKFKLTNVVLQHLYYFAQNRTGSLETSTPDYHIIHLALNMKVDFDNPLFLSFGVRNLLNEQYIPHLSGLKNLGIPNPGFNIFGSIRYEFNRKNK